MGARTVVNDINEKRNIARRLLGLLPDAAPAKIKRAYLNTAQRIHPDKASPSNKNAATEAFQYLSGAYRALTGKNTWASYTPPPQGYTLPSGFNKHKHKVAMTSYRSPPSPPPQRQKRKSIYSFSARHTLWSPFLGYAPITATQKRRIALRLLGVRPGTTSRENIRRRYLEILSDANDKETAKYVSNAHDALTGIKSWETYKPPPWWYMPPRFPMFYIPPSEPQRKQIANRKSSPRSLQPRSRTPNKAPTPGLLRTPHASPKPMNWSPSVDRMVWSPSR